MKSIKKVITKKKNYTLNIIIPDVLGEHNEDNFFEHSEKQETTHRNKCKLNFNEYIDTNIFEIIVNRLP